jgi:hypothetical protein
LLQTDAHASPARADDRSITDRTTPSEAEQRFRRLLSETGLDAPDRVEHGRDEVIFFWDDRRLAIIVELAGDVPGPTPRV